MIRQARHDLSETSSRKPVSSRARPEPVSRPAARPRPRTEGTAVIDVSSVAAVFRGRSEGVWPRRGATPPSACRRPLDGLKTLLGH